MQTASPVVCHNILEPAGSGSTCISTSEIWLTYDHLGLCIQVAAVDKPQVHLWETGITRITRHPQNTGQLIWCLGHLLWIGNSFMLTTSAALVAHHVFACYHGDFRLERKHGKVSFASAWLLPLHSYYLIKACDSCGKVIRTTAAACTLHAAVWLVHT